MSTPYNPLVEKIDFGQLAATPPTSRQQQPGPPPNERSLAGELAYGFRGELANAVKIAGNVVGVAQKAAEKYSKATGQDITTSLSVVQDFLRDMEEGVSPGPKMQLSNVITGEPPAPEQEPSFGRKLVRAVGAAPVQIVEYAAATALTRNPIAGFALVDAARELDKGPMATLKGAALGAVEGAVLGKVMKITRLPKRMAAGAVAGGTGASIRGGGVEDVAAGALMGGGFTSLPHASRKASAEAMAKPTKIKIVDPPEDLLAGLSWFRSPSQMFKIDPEARGTVFDVILAERRTSHMAAMWERDSRRAVGKLTESDWSKVKGYMGDEKYTLDSPPKDTPAVVDAYLKLRPVTRDVRGQVIDMKRQMGEPNPEQWGFEEGYFPHRFQGQWMILYDGEPVPNGWRADSKRQALARREEYLRLDPNADPAKLSVEFFKPEPKEGYGAESLRRFWGHGQKRTSDMPGWAGTREDFYAYLNGAARYVNLAPLRPKMVELQARFRAKDPNSELTRRWDFYVDRVEGRPDSLSQGINLLAQQWGMPSRVVEKSLGFIRSVQTVAKLGFSPISALQNMFQIPVNLYPVLGAKYTWAGYKGFVSNFRTGKYNKLLDDLYIRDAITKADEGSFIEKSRLYWPRSIREAPRYAFQETSALAMYMFRNAEYSNRAISVIGAYERALAEGATKTQATRRAFETEVRTQFSISQGDSPVVLSTPWARTAFQFKSFWQKQLEFMTGLTRKNTPGRFDTRSRELGRFVAAVVASTGIVGIPGAELVDSVLERVYGYSPLKRLKEAGGALGKTLVGGLPSAAKVDMSNAGFGDWFNARNLNPFGPTTQEAVMLVQWIKANPGRESDDLLRQLKRRAVPEVRRIMDAALSESAKRGEILDSSGRIAVQDITPTERALMVAGLTPERISEERETYSQDIQSKARYDSMQQGYVSRAVELRRAGKYDEADKVIKEAAENGFPDVRRSVVLRMRNLRLPRIEQLRRGARKTFRRIEQQQGRGEEKLDFGRMAAEPPPTR